MPQLLETRCVHLLMTHGLLDYSSRYNEHPRLAELAHIPNWALLNNLKLSSSKSYEIILLSTG